MNPAPHIIRNARNVLRAMVKRRSGQRLTQLADTTGIERERLVSFRRGGDLPAPDLQRLSYKLLHRQAKYHIDTDTLTGREQP